VFGNNEALCAELGLSNLPDTLFYMPYPSPAEIKQDKEDNAAIGCALLVFFFFIGMIALAMM